MSRMMPAVPRGTVVTVDDEADILDVMNVALRRGGFRVHGASSYDELLMCLKEVKFDVIVLDLCMPDQDGFWVAESIRASELNTPIVFVTAHDSPSFRLRASLIVNARYMTKPFDPDELVDAVTLAMGGCPV